MRSSSFRILTPALALAGCLVAGPLLAQYPNPGTPAGPGTTTHCSGTEAVVVEARSNLRFVPAEPTIQAGQSICFKNVSSGIPHNVHVKVPGSSDVICSTNCSDSNAPSGSLWQAPIQFPSAGDFNFQCDQHVSFGMVGVVHVTAAAPPPPPPPPPPPSSGNDDPGRFKLSKSSYSVGENVGNATVQVEREEGTSGAVSVQVKTADGTATDGSDYTGIMTTLAWGNGDGTNKNASIPILDDSTTEPTEQFTVSLANPSGGATLAAPSSAQVSITDDDVDFGSCVADEHTLCVGPGGRFKISVHWRTHVAEGEGTAVATDGLGVTSGGLFSFFSADNPEMLVKVVDLCGPVGSFTVFIAATTNVEYDVTVIDTVGDAVKTYHNDLDHAADPVQDPAFATCSAFSS